MTPIKKFILLFKAQKDADLDDKYETFLQEQGYVVKQVKTLDFSYVNLEDLKEKLDSPTSYRGIVFTSPRCVFAAKLALNGDQISNLWKQKANFVVGQGTYELALNDLGLDCEGKDTGNASNLSETIIKGQKKCYTPFLFPHGNLNMNILKSRLCDTFITLDEILVYETISNPNVEDELRKATNGFCDLPEFMVFFSPSGVNTISTFLKEIPVEMIKLIAIGPTTQKAMENEKLNVFGVADRPTPEALLDVIR